MKKNLLILMIFLGIALSLNIKNQWFLVPAVLGTIFLMDRKVFRMILKWKFLFFLALLVLAVPLFAGIKDAAFYGIPYSSQMFHMSVVMAGRSIIILLSLRLFTSRISVEQLAEGMQRIHLRQFSQVFALSMQTLPQIRTIAGTTYREYRDKPRRKNIFAYFFNFAVILIIRILEFANTLSSSKA